MKFVKEKESNRRSFLEKFLEVAEEGGDKLKIPRDKLKISISWNLKPRRYPFRGKKIITVPFPQKRLLAKKREIEEVAPEVAILEDVEDVLEQIIKELGLEGEAEVTFPFGGEEDLGVHATDEKYVPMLEKAIINYFEHFR